MNDSLECELHGKYDIWVMQDGKVLVTDLGFPSDEPKQCLALGVSQELATGIADEKSQQLGTAVITTQRRCLRCRALFWISEHGASSSALQTAKGYFCPTCARQETQESVTKELGILGCWCG
jgi:hypothetical protein